VDGVLGFPHNPKKRCQTPFFPFSLVFIMHCSFCGTNFSPSLIPPNPPALVPGQQLLLQFFPGGYFSAFFPKWLVPQAGGGALAFPELICFNSIFEGRPAGFSPLRADVASPAGGLASSFDTFSGLGLFFAAIAPAFSGTPSRTSPPPLFPRCFLLHCASAGRLAPFGPRVVPFFRLLSSWMNSFSRTIRPPTRLGQPLLGPGDRSPPPPPVPRGAGGSVGLPFRAGMVVRL